MLLHCLDKLVDRGTPIAANRTLAAISKLFNWAITRDLIETSPVARIGKPGGREAALANRGAI
jgi:hypothetical protein